MEQALQTLITQGGAIAAMLVLVAGTFIWLLRYILGFQERIISKGLSALDDHTAASKEMYRGQQEMNKAMEKLVERQERNAQEHAETLILLRKMNGKT